jgi:F0F1-type ATP synthase membrane subunit b/b'
MEQAVDLNLILGIIFGLLGIFLVVLWIAVPFVVFSMRKSLNETNRRLEEILSRRPEDIVNKRLEEILLELKTLTTAMQTQAAPIEEKSKNRHQRHRVTQLYRTPKEEDPNK